MLSSVSVLIPSDSSRAVVALAFARALAPSVSQVVVSGSDVAGDATGVEIVQGTLAQGIERLRGECTVLIDPGIRATAADVDALCAPIEAGDADVVVPAPADNPANRALNALALRGTGLEVRNPLAPLRAVRTEAIGPSAFRRTGFRRGAGDQARCPGVPVPEVQLQPMRADRVSGLARLGRTL